MFRKILLSGAVLVLSVMAIQSCGPGEAPEPQTSQSNDELRRRRPRPPAQDAGTPVVDAGTPAPDGGLVNVPGRFACYTQGAPTATCGAPDHCCFDNYSSQHNGTCTATPKSCYGDMTCDGPEDCPSGGSCCAIGIKDPTGEFVVPIGYRIACQADACPIAPTNRELCHPGPTERGTCSNPTAKCVSAKPNFSSFPAVLYVCQ